MKISIVTSRFPFPLIKGDILRIFHQIRILSRRHEISLIALTDREVSAADYDHIKAFCAELHFIRVKSMSRYKSVLKHHLKVMPMQVSYFYDDLVKKQVQQLIAEYQPDIAYFQLIRTAPYAEGLSCPVVLDYMDAFSTIAARDADYSSGIRAAILRRESRRLAHYEKLIFKQFSGHTVISKNDAELLNVGPLRVISNGVDIDYFQPSAEPKKFDLCFIGNLGYAPNVRAAEYLVTKVLPRIRFKYPETNLLLAGARPSHKVLSYVCDHVSVWSELEDIRVAYGASRIFLAPLFTGAGQQNKILEAMAMGLPCITTTIVNSSIEAGTDVIKIAFSDSDFIKYSIRLLNQPDMYASQQKAALKFVADKFSWEQQIKQLEAYFTSVIAKKEET